MKASQIGVFSFSGLGVEDSQALFSKLNAFLLPSVAGLAGRKPHLVRRHITGPTILHQSRVQSECRFRGKGLSCEIRLYEGLFLAMRCFSEVVARQSAIPAGTVSMLDLLKGRTPSISEEPMSRSDAVDALEAVLERFWQRPDDPMGMWEFLEKSYLFQPDSVRPVADILTGFHPTTERHEMAQQLVLSASLFTLAHELGHYVVRSTQSKDQLTAAAAAVRLSGVRVYEEWQDSWAETWSSEFLADLQGMYILLHFGQRIAQGKIPEIRLPYDADTALAGFAIESLTAIFFALGCVHLLETYGFARFGKPYLVSAHPPAYRRRELLVQSFPPIGVLPLTAVAERLWVELESLLGDVLTRLDRQGRLAVTGDRKADIINHLGSARERFERDYLKGNLFRQLQALWDKHPELKEKFGL